MKATELLTQFSYTIRDNDDKDIIKMVSSLNRAIDFFLDKVSPYVDKNEKFTRWLYPIKKTGVQLKSKKKGKDFDRFEFPKNWANIISVEALCSKKPCGDKVIVMHNKRTRYVPGSKDSKYQRPNFLFRHGFYEVDSEGLKLYHMGDYKIKSAEVSYLEKIPRIQVGSLAKHKSGYVYTDGERVDYDKNLKLGVGAYNPIIQIAQIFHENRLQDLQEEGYRILNLNNIKL